MSLRIGILGPLEVASGSASIEIGGTRLRALLIRLALDAGRVVSASSLSEAVWGEDGGPADPDHALQSLVSRLRHLLPAPAALVPASGGYRLDVPAGAVDAVRFERLAADGRRALRSGQPEVAGSLLREALGLWRGEPLADVAEAPFAGAAAVRLRELALAATEDRAEAELHVGADPSRLAAELEEHAAGHPLRERLQALRLRVLQAAGRQAEALAAYEVFRRRLADELGSDPGPELQATHRALLRGERLPDASGGVRRGNLPAALTSFVGRIDEQAWIRRQLSEGRLVTLVGPGGCGKTRLALAVASTIADELPGGAWLAELAQLDDPGEVPAAVASALGLRELGALEGPRAPRDDIGRLIEALSASEALIVLDNCEHLVEAAARLGERLLAHCPRLRVLATSREPLGIVGEALCPVGPLALPEPGAAAAVALAHSAVRVFADRAAAVRPGFTVDDGNVAAVVEVCRRLDGLPLAIELAAARLRSLPVEQLARRLDDRFQLLEGGARTAPPRQRTLRAVVAWSWDLLGEEERRLARRIAVFPAMITPGSAGRVWAPSSASLPAMDALSALVDRSLLQRVEGPEPRYRMLETIREYGLERLAEAGELDEARAAHATCFLELAERAAPHLRGRGQVPWLAELRSERENLLAALRYACEAADADTAVRLGAALGVFWTIEGSHEEAARWLGRTLDLRGQASAEARTVAVALYLLNAVLSGGSTVSLEGIRSRARGGALRDDQLAWALIEPLLHLLADDPAAGLAAIADTPSADDPWGRAMLLLVRSLLLGNLGGLVRMRDSLAAAANAFREAGERWGAATSLTYLAYTQTMSDEFGAAAAGLEEAIRLLHELDPEDATVMQRVWLATARARQGDLETARAALQETVASGGGRPARHLVFARIALGDLARQEGDLAEAGRQYGTAAELGEASSEPLFRAMVQCAEGHLAVSEGELASAERLFGAALALAVEAPDMPFAAEVGVGVARLLQRRGAAREAAEALGAAHTLRGAPDASNPDVARLVEALRGGLGERAYDAADAGGRRLDRNGALALLQAQLRRR